MKTISFRNKILLLSIVPFIVFSLLVIGVSIYQVKLLGQQNANEFSKRLYDLRRKELKNYSDLAVSAVKHITDNESSTNAVAISKAKAILNDLSYGDDGYFFVYDSWINQIIPASKELKGSESDLNGLKVVESFYKTMTLGGGYTDYSGWRPTHNRYVDKIAYSDKLSGWDWWFGTGVYVDDLKAAIASVEDSVHHNIVRTVSIILMVATVGVFAIGFFTFKLTFSESKLADEKLQKLSLKNVVTQEKERARIARALHSSVSYKLTESKNKLKELARSDIFIDSDKASRDNFLLAAKSLFDATTEIRRISGDLRPPVLDKEGLVSAINAYIHKQQNLHNNIKISFSNKNITNHLGAEIDISLYRILQEALSNVFQHANAKDVSVRLVQHKDSISLTVKDDGNGFDVKEVMGKSNKAGIGLVDMKIRAESLGGKLAVHSSSGIGSHIKVEIPL